MTDTREFLHKMWDENRKNNETWLFLKPELLSEELASDAGWFFFSYMQSGGLAPHEIL